jgi:hypothetical protein
MIVTLRLLDNELLLLPAGTSGERKSLKARNYSLPPIMIVVTPLSGRISEYVIPSSEPVQSIFNLQSTICTNSLLLQDQSREIRKRLDSMSSKHRRVVMMEVGESDEGSQ